MKKHVLDTNVLLKDSSSITTYTNVIIPTAVLEELNIMKERKTDELAYKAREALRTIEQNLNNITFLVKDSFENVPSGWDSNLRDNKIVFTARDLGADVVSNDLNLRLKAKALQLEAFRHDPTNVINNDYKGFKEISLNEEEQAKFYSKYSGTMDNVYDLDINEYMIMLDEVSGQVIDAVKWTEYGYAWANEKILNSLMFGKIKPRDVYQTIAIDSLLSTKDITMLSGAAGTAKTLLSLGYIFQQLDKNKFDKVVIIHNPVPMNRSAQLGFYTGSRTDKLLQTSLGGILCTKLGSELMVETLIKQGKLQLIPLADARGFEATEHTCLYVTEAQNMDIYLLKTVLQRAAEGCKVIIEGDMNTQVDCNYFQGSKNGMRRAMEVFKGSDCFSYVELQKIYRSKIAEIAEGM